MNRQILSILVLILLLSGESQAGAFYCDAFLVHGQPGNPREIVTRLDTYDQTTSRSGITPGFKIVEFLKLPLGISNLWGSFLRRIEQTGKSDYEVETFHVTVDSNIVVTHSRGKITEVYDRYTSKRITTIPYGGKTNGLTEGVLSVSGDFLVLGRRIESGRAGATLYDKNGTQIMSVDAENQPIRASIISADQSTWIIARESSMEFYNIKQGSMWSAENGRNVVSPQIGTGEKISTAAINTKGTQLFVALYRLDEARVILFDISGEQITYVKELTRLSESANPGLEGINPIVHIQERRLPGINLVMSPVGGYKFDRRDLRTIFIEDPAIELN